MKAAPKPTSPTALGLAQTCSQEDTQLSSLTISFVYQLAHNALYMTNVFFPSLHQKYGDTTVTQCCYYSICATESSSGDSTSPDFLVGFFGCKALLQTPNIKHLMGTLLITWLHLGVYAYCWLGGSYSVICIFCSRTCFPMSVIHTLWYFDRDGLPAS